MTAPHPCQALRALLTRVIDYAGMYPPAALPVRQAAQDFVAYTAHPDSWMLARFVCGVGKLGELDAAWREFSPPEALMPLSIVASPAETPEAALDLLTADVNAIHQLRQASPRRLDACALDLRIPAPAAVGPANSIADFVQSVCRELTRSDLASLDLFFEPRLAGSAPETMALAAEAVAAAAASRPSAITGLKLRLGGATAADFPSSRQVADCLQAAAAAGAAVKFTAGLHHPVRRFDPGLRTMMHGFLNVLVAALLAYSNAFDTHDLIAVLEEQDMRQFSFDDEAIGWNDAWASLADIQACRRRQIISFGSCSFDEPREDLRSMRLL